MQNASMHYPIDVDQFERNENAILIELYVALIIAYGRSHKKVCKPN